MYRSSNVEPRLGYTTPYLILTLIMLSGVTGCSGEPDKANPEAGKEKRLEIPVTVQEVKLGSFTTYIHITATLKGKKSVWVLSDTSGVIERMEATEGDSVMAGGLIAQVEDEEPRYALQEAEAAYALAKANYEKLKRLSRPQEVEVQRATVESTEADLRTAELDLARAERLYREGILPKERYDSARARHQAAKSAHHAAQEQLSLLEEGARQEDITIAKAQADQAEARLLLARKQLQDTRIESPISGRVVKLPVVAGDRISPGTRIAEVIDLATLEAEVGLTQEEIAFVHEGDSVHFETYAFPGLTFQGTVSYVGLKASEQSGLFPVTIRVRNREESLRPGIVAVFRIPKQQFRDAVVIPRDAVIEKADGPMVFVVDRNKAWVKPVVLGEAQGDRTIVKEGLIPGETLVVIGQHSLQDGTWIRVEKMVDGPREAAPQPPAER